MISEEPRNPGREKESGCVEMDDPVLQAHEAGSSVHQKDADPCCRADPSGDQMDLYRAIFVYTRPV